MLELEYFWFRKYEVNKSKEEEEMHGRDQSGSRKAISQPCRGHVWRGGDSLTVTRAMTAHQAALA